MNDDTSVSPIALAALTSMIELQRQLQTRSFGFDFEAMTEQERVEYLRWNVLALTDELHEILSETSWKPWAKTTYIHDEKAFNELVDAFHFLMNLMLVIFPTLDSGRLAQELATRYAKKNAVNVKRSEMNYDGKTTKCDGCRRALDDPGMIHNLDGVNFECASCGFPIPPSIAKTVDNIQS